LPFFRINPLRGECHIELKRVPVGRHVSPFLPNLNQHANLPPVHLSFAIFLTFGGPLNRRNVQCSLGLSPLHTSLHDLPNRPKLLGFIPDVPETISLIPEEIYSLANRRIRPLCHLSVSA
jgi:hypothetical protein